MSYFPFFVEIGQKRCLVVGGGTVAFRKIEKLLPFGVEITVVSPSFCAEIEHRSLDMCTLREVTPTAAATAFMEMVRQGKGGKR